MSAYVMRRDHYECQECRKKLNSGIPCRIRRATQVHHIIPYEQDPERGLDEDNLEAVCSYCHNLAHGRDGRHLKKNTKKRATEEKW